MISSDASEIPAPPDMDQITDAAQRLTGIAVRTPLLESVLLNEEHGGRILVKAEMLQHTGSFKFRGAYNRISRLDKSERSTGVIAYSSGNHAQAVAAVAKLLDLPATVVMPSDAPRIKVESTRTHGARIVSYDRASESREEIAASISAQTGATLIRPFDDPHIIAGQGTVGLEIAQQATELDEVLVPCGGGGLIAGTGLAIHHHRPQAGIHAVEPEQFDDTKRSLQSGRRESVATGATSFCDALMVPTPGELTFSINQRLLSGGLVVTDREVAAAMAACFRHFKLVVEPGGAVALAAVLTGKMDCRGKTIVVVCSGGNVDLETYRAALKSA